MGDVDELIGRLRAWKAQYRGDGDESTIPLAAEAADALTALQAELAQCAKGHAEIASWYEDAAKGWSAAQVQVAALQARLAAVEAERDAAREALADVGNRIEMASDWYHNTQEWHDDDSLPSHIADGNEATVGTLLDWVMEPTTRTLKGTDHG